MSILNNLLRKNTSNARIAGFVISNFLGLAIILGALQFYTDSRPLWQDDDSFLKSDFLIVNKKIDSANLWEDSAPQFSADEIADLRSQPWVRDAGAFSAADYRVWASVSRGGRGMSTLLFFESIPDNFVDAGNAAWHFSPGDQTVPIIISKDYLTLYNFGFAGSAGLPRMSESIMSGIPLQLELSSDDGQRRISLQGRIVGFSNRLNTILVPQTFMDWSNSTLGSSSAPSSPSRLAIDVSSPGDVAIARYLADNNLEAAGDKSASSASFMLKVVVGIIMAVGIVITILSLFILLLSMSLLLEKNRDKLHSLLMLGYTPSRVAAPYRKIVMTASVIALLLALAATFLLRMSYLPALEGLGAVGGNVWGAILAGVAITAILVAVNLRSVARKVKDSWR